jgi:hypothetical protein
LKNLFKNWRWSLSDIKILFNHFYV